MLHQQSLTSPDAFLSGVAAVVDPVLAFEAWAGGCDPWQSETLSALIYEAEPLLILYCSRQTGKSSVLAAGAYLLAELRPGTFCTIAAPAERQAKELFLKLKSFRRSLDSSYDLDKDTESEMRLRNGSRVLVVTVNENTSRGLSQIDVLLLDEAARIKDIDIQALVPALRDSGMLCMASTPAGRQGYYYNALKNKLGRIITAQSTKLARKKAAVERDRRLMSDSQFKIEHMLEFGENGSSFFNVELIRKDGFTNAVAAIQIGRPPCLIAGRG